MATSTGEAEYMAIRHSYLVQKCNGTLLGRSLKAPIPVNTDNTGALTNIIIRGFITGLKRIRVKYHVCKERHEQKEIKAKGTRIHDQLVDIFQGTYW